MHTASRRGPRGRRPSRFGFRCGSTRFVADHPNNPARTIEERRRQLQQRLDDAALRLAVLDQIEAYDNALLALAEGRDPKAIEADVRGLLEGLQRLPLKRVSEEVAGLVPYADVVTGVINQVDQLVRARRFRKAVKIAAPAIEAMVQALGDDAANLTAIRAELIELERDDVRGDALQLKAALDAIVATPAGSRAVREARRLERANAALALFPFKPALALAAPAAPTTRPADEADRSLVLNVEQAVLKLEELASQSRAFDKAIAAQHDALPAYREVLARWDASHRTLRQAGDQVDLDAAVELTRAVLELREAYLLAEQAADAAR